jgi:precorrin-4 methylase
MRSKFEQLVENLRSVLPGSTPLAVVCHAGRSEQHTAVRATLDTAVAALQGREVPFEHLVYVGDFLAD